MRKKNRNRLFIIGVLLIVLIATVFLMTKPKKNSSDVPSSGNNIQTGDTTATPNPESNSMAIITEKSDSGNNDSEGSTKNSNVTLAEADISYLESIVMVIPEFWEAKDRNEEFWANLLYDLYYNSDGETEDRYRFAEELGTTATYRKVSIEEIDALSEELFGENMTDSIMASEVPKSTFYDIGYVDGYFYINKESDGVAYYSEFVGLNESKGWNEATFSIKHVDSDWEGIVTLGLAPAKNKRGFILTGKEMNPVNKASGEILDNQVYKVSMKPLGDVTFVAYKPEDTKNDVSFGLLKGEQEIYNFNIYDEAFYTGNLEYKDIADISFPDYNSDGYTDIVVLVDYYMYDSEVSQVRMFSGTDEGYFIWENYLVDAYNNSHDTKSIEDVVSFVGLPENQILFTGTSVIGSWEITKVAGTSKVYALSEEEMNAYLHAYLAYGRYTYDFCVTGQEQQSGAIEGYHKESMSAEEFLSLYGIAKQPDGPETKRYDTYQVIGKSGDSVFGDTVILIDQDNAYIYYEGVFFLAKREL